VRGPFEAARLLRADVLDGVFVLLAGAVVRDATGRASADGDGDAIAQKLAEVCSALGAQVLAWRPGERVPGAVDALVVDCGASFAAARAAASGEDPATASRAALSECLDGAWEATREVANAAFIDARRAGRIVYLAPAAPPASRAAAAPFASAPTSAAAEHRDAARAGLENLARTLSIEWARHTITTVAIAPGASTRADELAALCAYLCSPAGSYFSGCQLDLRDGLASIADR
jgi:NAD(P)-dependent dehydrogenase (short-subunit alcohol dehydrogenase family)